MNMPNRYDGFSSEDSNNYSQSSIEKDDESNNSNISDLTYEQLKVEIKKLKLVLKSNLRSYFVQRKYDDIHCITPLVNSETKTNSIKSKKIES